MTQTTVTIDTGDGKATASLHLPDGDGPWPGIVMFPDAGSLRETFDDMGARLAGFGYATLVPDVYYRAGHYAPFDMRSAFADPAERERLMSMMGELTPEKAARDADAYVTFLLGRPETTGTAAGVTGYCMGGRMSLTTAGQLGDRVAAAASFHGGNLAAADDPASPHLLADGMSADVYVAGATDDRSFPDDQQARLEDALTDASVDHTIEIYPAGHGFAVADTAAYDEGAADRHWKATAAFFAAHLDAAGSMA